METDYTKDPVNPSGDGWFGHYAMGHWWECIGYVLCISLITSQLLLIGHSLYRLDCGVVVVHSLHLCVLWLHMHFGKLCHGSLLCGCIDAGNNPRDQWDEHLSEGRSGTSTVAARTQ